MDRFFTEQVPVFTGYADSYLQNTTHDVLLYTINCVFNESYVHIMCTIIREGNDFIMEIITNLNSFVNQNSLVIERIL